MNHPVAETILAQLGGNKFVAMTGAKNFVASADLLQFDLPGVPKINKVQVKLAGNDLYTVAFYKWNNRTLNLNQVAVRNGIGVSELKDVFTTETGLILSL